MSHAQIVATYSDGALKQIIVQLTIHRNMPDRLKAAIAEQKSRKAALVK